jgi:hypothetical protein
MVSIHTNPSDQSRFIIGFVDQIDDTWARLRSLSIRGKDDGYEIISLKKIFRISINGRYEHKINFINNNRKQVFKEVELSLPIETDNVLYATLHEAHQKELIVMLWTEDEFDSVIGYVDSLDQDMVRILAVNDYGQEDGFIVLDLTEVRSIDCNSLKCQIIKFLHKNTWE